MNYFREHLGYYVVNDKIFLSKAVALIEASRINAQVKWVFNDDIYSKFDWSSPIDATLPELYRQRAKQLREKYDYLMFYFSGGNDSTNALHAFIDNNIFLDEIVMQYPKHVESSMNNIDTGQNNFYSEVKYAAFPHLEACKHLLDKRTKIRIEDTSEMALALFSTDKWVGDIPVNAFLSPISVARQFSAINDKAISTLYEKGKFVCQIYGVDKPLVTVHNNNYFAYFRDSNASHALTSGFRTSEVAEKHFNLEFFYWARDLPEIVIKQAQVIKQHAMVDLNVKKCLGMGVNIGAFRNIIDPLVYNSTACAEKFQTEKADGRLYRPMDSWFWQPENSIAVGNYLTVIDHLQDVIAPRFSIDDDFSKGFRSIESKAYKL